MSALAEALVAAQRRALSALQKTYVHSPLSAEELEAEKDHMREIMDAIGCTDTVEQSQLLAALDVIRATGAQLPAEPANGGEPKPPELASQRQRDWIADLFGKSNYVPMDSGDVAKLTKSQASKLIDALQAGTYEASEWDVPI